MGRQNVKVCKIWKKISAPPSETYFRHASKQNKRFRSQTIHSKIVSKTYQQNVTEIKKFFSLPKKCFEKLFENDFAETPSRTENPPAPMFNRNFDLSAPHATSKAIIAV